MSNPVNENLDNNDVLASQTHSTNIQFQLKKLAALKSGRKEFTGKFIPLETNEHFQNPTPSSEYQNQPTPTQLNNQFNPTQFQDYHSPVQSNNNQFNPNHHFPIPVPTASNGSGNSEQNQSQLTIPLTFPGLGGIDQKLNQVQSQTNEIKPFSKPTIPNQSLKSSENTTIEKLPEPNRIIGKSIIKSFFRKITGINQPDNKENIPTVEKNSDVRSVQENLNAVMKLEKSND